MTSRPAPDRRALNEELTEAAAQGQAEVVRILLERGADPNVGDGSPLLDALKYQAWSSRPDYVDRYRRTIDLLIDHGANVNVVTHWESHQDQYTPLSRAASYGDERLVKKLIAKGAAVNPGLHPQALPLYLAKKNGYPKVVILLKRAGTK